MRPAVWQGHPGPSVRRDGRRRNDSWTCAKFPGYTVRHCGHPTAIWPYYVEGAEHLGTFRRLEEAQAAVAVWWARSCGLVP